jgi:hypothetical protein
MLRCLAFFLIALLNCDVHGQLGPSNVGEIKIRAEKGDAQAQYELGEAYLDSFYYADAAKWFRAAAEKGVVNAQWRLGQMLLTGHGSFAKRPAVAADPSEGVQWLKKAANAGNWRAQMDLARCYERGTAVNKDFVEAYKWYGILAKTHITGGPFRDQLALKMSTAEIREGERRIESFTAGASPDVFDELNLKLKGISGTKQKRFALISSATVAEGDNFSVRNGGAKVTVVCEKIGEKSVIVSIGNKLRELKME